MEEKKKRFRPTLGAYRELEAKVKAQEELIDKLKCVGMTLVTQGEEITTKLKMLTKDIISPEHYQELLEAHSELSAKYSELQADYKALQKKYEWLLNRNLLDRIKNKKRGC